MRAILLLAILGGLGWWYFYAGNRIAEADVQDFFRKQTDATLSRNPDGLCALLDEAYQADGTTVMMDQAESREHLDREQSCQAYRDLYDSFAKLGDKMGGLLQLDYGYEIHSIEVASDRRSAVADVSYQLDVAGSLMNIRSRSQETLVRRHGRTLLLQSEGTGSVSTGE